MLNMILHIRNSELIKGECSKGALWSFVDNSDTIDIRQPVLEHALQYWNNYAVASLGYLTPKSQRILGVNVPVLT